MPWYVHKEIWTPLKLFNIRLYRDMQSSRIWLKWRYHRRHPVRRQSSKDTAHQLENHLS